jgi:hypothetical protein
MRYIIGAVGLIGSHQVEITGQNEINLQRNKYVDENIKQLANDRNIDPDLRKYTLDLQRYITSHCFAIRQVKAPLGYLMHRSSQNLLINKIAQK